jgi:predicted HTH transcriptional regulator
MTLLIDLHTIDDIQMLRETHSLECKLATGQDGKGNLPNDFWESYSAMANTHGGVVLLGIKEKKGRFHAIGLQNLETVQKQVVDTVNNRQKVSVNVLSNHSFEEIELEGKRILKVVIPQASRNQKPVYLNNQPLGNSYHRLNEADQVMTDEDVKRALSEQVNDTQDNRILVGYGLNDLAVHSVQDYRQMFSVRQPSHPYNKLDDSAFLERIGGWRRNRETGEAGLTVAGLLMFGEDFLIKDVFPYFQLDYQERPEAKTEQRWIDRVTLDGTWAGNLFEFYQIVYQKLKQGLKVPFELKDGIRQADTPLHEAIREALCNVLVHADYSGRASILIVKRPDLIGFRNPGLMRVPVEEAIKGGHPDCRNRSLHQMFSFIGVGEKSGTGLPKVYDNCKQLHWKKPQLEELISPSEQTQLRLWMTDLLPQGAMATLSRHFGQEFSELGYLKQLALGIALTETVVTHERLLELSSEHPADISKALSNLVEKKWLTQSGHSRGSCYHLTAIDDFLPKTEDLFGANPPSSGSNPPSSGSNPPSSGSNSPSSDANRDEFGRLISHHAFHRFNFVDDLEKLSEAYKKQLFGIAEASRSKKRISKEILNAIILELCQGQYVSIAVLASITKRSTELLRKDYLPFLLKDRKLELAFPTERNSPKQAYTSTNSGDRSP